VGVLSYFNDNKIKVPQQVAVIGFAIGLCRKYLKKLSTVDQSFNGRRAFNLLLEEMNCHKEGKPFTPRTIELETNISLENHL
jgi:LacI family transcriptional regulator